MLRLLIVALLGLLPTLSWSLGVGDIEVDSTLNAPLNARIPLTALRDGEIDQIRVSVASSEAFRRVGLERTVFILGLQFQVVPGDTSDQATILVTSRRAAREPFVSFLLEITSGGSRVLREYTLLLDPQEMQVAERQAVPVVTVAPKPMATPEPAAVAAPVAQAPAQPAAAAPTVAPQPTLDVAREQQVGVPEPEIQYANEPLPRAVDVTEPEPVSVVAAEPKPALPGAAMYGPVTAQETLWRIATTVRPDAGITMDQVMWSLYNGNRDQFDGDINHVMVGAMLKVPGRDEMLATAPDDATRLVRGGARQVAAKPAPSVVPIPKPKPGPAPTKVAAPVAAPAPTAVAQAPAATPAPQAEAEAQPAEAAPEPEQAAAEPEAEDAFAALDQLAQDTQPEPAAAEAEAEALGEELTPEEIESAQDAFAEPEAPATEDAFAAIEGEGGEAAEAEAPAPQEPAAAEEELENPFAELDQLTEAAEEPGAEPEVAQSEEPKAEVAEEEPEAAPKTLAPPPAPEPKAESLMDSTVALGPLELPLIWLIAGGGALVALLGAGAVVARRKKASTGGAPKAKKAKVKKAPEVEEPEEPEFEEEGTGDEMAAAAAVEAEVSVAPEEPQAPVGIDLAEESEPAAEGAMAFERPVEPEQPPAGGDETQILEAPPELKAPAPAEPEHVGTETVSLELSEDPMSEADFHIAYGLYDEAAMLLTQAIEADPDRLELREKLAETYFASGNAAEFETTARELKQRGVDAAAWQKLVILGQQICPDSDLFAGATAEAGGGIDMDLGGGAGGGAGLDFSLDDDVTGEDVMLADEAPAAAPEEPASDEESVSLDDSLEFDLGELEVPSEDEGEQPEARVDDNLMEFDVSDIDVPAATTGEEVEPDTGNLVEFDLGTGDAEEAPADEGFSLDEGLSIDKGELPDEGFSLDEGVSLDEGLSLDEESAPAEGGPDEFLADGGDLGEFDLSDELDGNEAPITDGDEMATKLDLARAYVDMGEGDMARSLLEDVLAGGDDAQKADAQALIDQLG